MVLQEEFSYAKSKSPNTLFVLFRNFDTPDTFAVKNSNNLKEDIY